MLSVWDNLQQDPSQLPDIIQLIEADLSEPYTLYTYRYFIDTWPELCILAHCEDRLVGVIVCKAEPNIEDPREMQGYIGMLVVDTNQRRRGIGTATCGACGVLLCGAVVACMTIDRIWLPE